MNELARNLTELLRRSGLMHKDVAKKIGVSRSAVLGYASGIRKPNPETIKKLCKALDCTYEELLGPIE